jgi:hypothetical protein
LLEVVVVRRKKVIEKISTMTVSMSFDPSDIIYSNCQERGRHKVLTANDGGPVVFIGTDQHFPAVLPSLD